ncbi:MULTISPECIES: hypothetical protein [unclassified Psychrobacter]|uniref:hypothetical protein n=1 Tax=unclassified Psychrobacter TaxID=196806 RepID=UPI0018F74DDD|nr:MULTISPECIES: hypothetical protein [unclassified Psychrobacter]
MSSFLSPTMAARRDQRAQRQKEQVQFDSMTAQQAADSIDDELIDASMAMAVTFQMRQQALKVVFLLAALLSDEGYDEQELLPSEALDGLMTQAFNDDDDDEALDSATVEVFSAYIADAFSTFGVNDDLINDLFDTDTETADSAILSAADQVLEAMPADDEIADFTKAFVYSVEPDDDDGDDTYDSMQFDAAKKTKLRAGKKTVKKVNGKTLVYKAVKAVRNGKVVTVNKRMQGSLKLSAAQKNALRKARRKSGTSSAIRKSMRSLGIGVSRGIYKGDVSSIQKAALGRHSKSIGI